MKEAHLDIDSMNQLIQELIRINHYIQTQPSVSLEQIQNQLGFIIFTKVFHIRHHFSSYGVLYRNA